MDRWTKRILCNNGCHCHELPNITVAPIKCGQFASMEDFNLKRKATFQLPTMWKDSRFDSARCTDFEWRKNISNSLRNDFSNDVLPSRSVFSVELSKPSLDGGKSLKIWVMTQRKSSEKFGFSSSVNLNISTVEFTDTRKRSPRVAFSPVERSISPLEMK